VSDPGDGDLLICSARGCRQCAVWILRWNNPRLHAPQRRKSWSACAEHRESLAEFLSRRGFLRETIPATAVPEVAGGTAREAAG
jgi:hypothetical protein